MASTSSSYLSSSFLPPRLLHTPLKVTPNCTPNSLSVSSSQSLQTPVSLSTNDTQIVYNKCLKLLRFSSRYGDVGLARAVHSLVLKLDEDNYLLNSLISCYFNLGFVSDAYGVFSRVSNPDVVSYTSMVSGFSRVGREVEAIRVFCRMRERGIDPNEFTFVAILSACSRILGLRLGFQVHGLVVKSGYLLGTYVANALMGLYSKCGCLDDALQMFDEMSERDIASWNTVISSVASVSLYGRALELFREMLEVDGLRVDHFTLSSVLSACAGCCDWMLGREIHAHALRVGFVGNLSVDNALIGFYTKCGRANDVQALFERMPVKDVISWTGMITAYMEFRMVDSAIDIFTKMPERNAVSFNALLDGLCRNGEGLKAMSLFYKMISHGVELTESTLTSAISACSLLAESRISEQMHGFVLKFGLKSNACIEAALVDMCTRCGRMEDAEIMFCQSQYDQNLSINWTSLICGYARNAQPEEAITLFQWWRAEEGMKIDEVVATTVLGVCGTLGFHVMGQQMHCHALKSGFLHDLRVGNAIISMYSKCGFMEEAIETFNHMPRHDAVSWNCLISGHLLQRKGDEALAVWSKMKRASIMPDSVTLALVISCYRHTNASMLDDCRHLFFSMKRAYDIEPTSDHYGCFVSVLGDWGYHEEAEDVLTNMPIEHKASASRALLHSCGIHLDSPVGKRISQRIMSMQPQDPATFILKSNLFSASGRWHWSEMVREEMRSKGFKKHPARSWIVHQNKVHSFYARDRSHFQSKDIYSGLEILILECLKVGYVPDTSFVLHDVEEHQKRDFLFYHSAKLAVTYGLLTNKTTKPVRLTKNILLCGDCHNFVKHVSLVTRREIWVRDSSGFHCFSDGKCSCKDRW